MAPNYAAGKDMSAGVERVFKGKIVGKDLTKWAKVHNWISQQSLAKAKASRLKVYLYFIQEKRGGAFIKQYAQAGLQGKIPLYSVFTVDSIALPKLQKAKMSGVMGSMMTQFWAPDLDNAKTKNL